MARGRPGRGGKGDITGEGGYERGEGNRGQGVSGQKGRGKKNRGLSK